MSMKKVVVKLASVHDEHDKQKALKAVSGISGIQSLGMDLKDQKMTIIGDIDPLDVVAKLRKKWHTEIVSVGAPETKDADAKKDAAKKDGETKDDAKKEKTEAEQIDDLINATKIYYQSHPCCMPRHYCY